MENNHLRIIRPTSALFLCVLLATAGVTTPSTAINVAFQGGPGGTFDMPEVLLR